MRSPLPGIEAAGRPGAAPDLALALLLTLGAWSALPAAGLLAACGVSPAAALFAAFLAATLLAGALRPRVRTSGVSARARAARLGLGIAAGFASYPLWGALIAASGLAMGLEPWAPVAPCAGTPLLWAATLGLAPVFEELVYRERLLPALEPRLGPGLALLLSSAAFALPHLEPWSVLASFLVGLALGGLMLRGRRVAPCIGLHLGLNLAALLRGVPPPGLALLLAVLALAPAARAAEMRWQGTLAFEFPAPGLPALALAGTGVATLNGSGGGSHLTALRLAGGLSATTTVPVSDPEVTAVEGIVALRASASLGSGVLAPFGTGPLTRSTLPVGGMLAVCLFDPACLPGGFVPVPLSDGTAGLGVGGTVTGAGVSILGAPWTPGTALLTLTTNAGGTLALPATGWVHGALSFTTSTALTGGALSLVTPLRVVSESGPPLSGFARLTLRFVPEPDRALVLISGALALAALGRTRRRT